MELRSLKVLVPAALVGALAAGVPLALSDRADETAIRSASSSITAPVLAGTASQPEGAQGLDPDVIAQALEEVTEEPAVIVRPMGDAPAPTDAPTRKAPSSLAPGFEPVELDPDVDYTSLFNTQSAPSTAEGTSSAPPDMSASLPSNGVGTVSPQLVPVLPGSAAPQDVVALIEGYFGDRSGEALMVAKCESALRPNAVGRPNADGTRDWGLFQLNDGGTLQGLLTGLGEDASSTTLALDAEWNVRAAKALYDDRGWQPWTCAAKVGLVDGLWSSTPGPAAGR